MKRSKEDIAWSKAVRDRDGRCVIGLNCSKQLNAHHLIPRENQKYRHDINNGITLCTRHHSKYGTMISPHSDNSAGFFIWLMMNKPTIWEWLKENAEIKL